jgi:hypothetical protein
MSKPWLSRILQIVGTLALVALVVIVYRRTDWCKGFTPDGIMTLVAGVLAFAAVQWQMWDQRRTLLQEQERQKKAVAAALLSEIDCFYLAGLSGRSELFESWERMGSDPKSLEVFYTVVGKSFVVYESLADKLGGFDSTITRSIVLTYRSMAAFVECLKIYEQEASDTSSPAPVGQEMRKTRRQQMQKEVRQSAEGAVQLAASTCRALCNLSETDFSKLFIAKESESRHQG